MAAELTAFELSQLTYEEKLELLKLLTVQDIEARRNWLLHYRPYQKQRRFHELGATFKERLFMAGNQLGKTLGGAAEIAMHATGRYPDWWQGRRYNRAISAIVGSESAELTKKGVQRLLLGQPELRDQWGTGAIPWDCLKDTSPRSGIPDAVASIIVKHVSGEDSVIKTLSYDQGRTKWQADTVDIVWFDEEPPLDIYSEGLTRTNATNGFVFLTFTPLKGMSDVVMRYLIEKQAGSAVVQMGIEDAEHYTEEERKVIIAQYPEHEREARARGEPMLGEGRVFTVAESRIKCRPFAIPPHWPRIAAIDFGWDHPTAIVWQAWDRDTDTLYVYDAYRVKGGNVAEHAVALRKGSNAWIPCAWPHDGLQHDKGSGEQIAQQYRDQMCNMLADKATFPPKPGTGDKDGGYGFEAGILEMNTRFMDGRYRVFDNVEYFFEEYKMYHRVDGLVVKQLDDVLSATRYGMMMRRFAQTYNDAHPAQQGGFQGAVPWVPLDPETGY